MTLHDNTAGPARDWDNAHFLHPWEGMESIGDNARTFAETARGIHVTSESGAELLDGPAGMWCMQLGYGNHEIAEAMADQPLRAAVDEIAARFGLKRKEVYDAALALKNAQ